MRICIVTDAWHPQINGVVTTLGHTLRVLAGWGHQVLTITPECFSTLPCPSYPEIRLSMVHRRSVLQRLRAFDPNAVHIVTEGPLGWAARSACRKLKLQFTTSYHTRFPEYIRARAPVPLKLSYAVVRRFHGAAERTMVAPTLIDELRTMGFANLVSWSRGVDTELFRPRAKDVFTGAGPFYLYVGRVAVEKNLPAFLDLRLDGTKVVVGEGPARTELADRYPEVLFTGAKTGEDLSRHMAGADCFVFPSRTDTFGVVMLEAMASGLPVAAFPVTGPRQVVVEGVNGALDEDLGAAIGRALAVPPQSCRDSVSAYSWSACTRQFFGNLAFH